MPRNARRGEIWQIDFSLAQKVRPALILTNYPKDDERALLTAISHTTSLKGNRWEVPIHKHFLKPELSICSRSTRSAAISYYAGSAPSLRLK
jgi:mRNA-degrading endonuclease toxin of MazEF toxin-antitoxin module